jgi:hypothetical protein
MQEKSLTGLRRLPFFRVATPRAEPGPFRNLNRLLPPYEHKAALPTITTRPRTVGARASRVVLRPLRDIVSLSDQKRVVRKEPSTARMTDFSPDRNCPPGM